MSWHVPSDEEIEFALTLFRDYVEPTLGMLEHLLETRKHTSHLHFIRHAKDT